MDKNEINHIAKLARLKFDDEGAESIAKDMSDIIKWVDMLQKADTASLAEKEESGQTLRMRADIVKDGGLSDKLMKNAAEPYEHFFTVPKVVE
ncbi:MAG: Asp-tRNA(Asn)/Glu-tRNA(Gln) amidotransferase subunit GatC [Mucispirillum sp.]|nr:Asp-tRNA(Asn)/Glu-tRNA(Gln) amidotransferase subunit GatC [Mucispirillum sp.]